MKDSSICLKPINDLLIDDQEQPVRYWVPAYQRGYRWAPLQITQLLDDIWEFIRPQDPKNILKPDDFYCLQPLVIMPRTSGDYEVVDGQQRLTTILLILRFFNRRFAKEFQKTIYNIDFETRGNFADFLAEPSEELADTNVDFFHLYQAIKTIEGWFADKQSFINDFESALLNRTKVIWFELAQGDNPVAAFTRLNVGKIPLTNDELIRALFLKRKDSSENKAAAASLKIAFEWDLLEKALQADPFWYFLNNQSGQNQNRIGFLFELIIKNEGFPKEAEHDAYGIFYAYSKKLKYDGIKPEDEWLKVKQAFMMLEEWFEDRILYHIVGFLIQQGVGVSEIRELSEKSTKSSFEQKLREKIFAITFKKMDDLDQLSEEELCKHINETLSDLEYSRDSSKIRSILLLFNLATLLENPRSNMRFQFDSFKEGDWDIEHVRSVAAVRPVRPHDRENWLKLCLGYLESRDKAGELCTRIKEFVRSSRPSDVSEELFVTLYEDLLDWFREKNEEGDVDNGIANLTLLDSQTNRSYKNAVFAVKRKRILDLDKSGIFVPLCTRNVFLKCYSPQADNVMFWSKEDREAYHAVMVNCLVGFFQGLAEVS